MAKDQQGLASSFMAMTNSEDFDSNLMLREHNKEANFSPGESYLSKRYLTTSNLNGPSMIYYSYYLVTWKS